MRSQKDVTLSDDLELRDRLDIYRNFLLYCLSGEVVALPMGSTVVVERDSSEFARLVCTLPPLPPVLPSCAAEHRFWARHSGYCCHACPDLTIQRRRHFTVQIRIHK